jgi:peptidyl-tRNA hydrolase, PTH2 family
MKQVILVRMDLKMPKGKFAAQCCHAAVDSVLKSDKKVVKEWREEGAKKIVLKVEGVRELNKYKRDADSIGLVTALIKDAGKTFFKKPTVTCCAIGPDKEEVIDRITSDLKMV